MVTTPTTPTRTDREFGGAVRTDGKEVDPRRENGMIRMVGEKMFVRP